MELEAVGEIDSSARFVQHYILRRSKLFAEFCFCSH
jgi:hypothetical protein